MMKNPGLSSNQSIPLMNLDLGFINKDTCFFATQAELLSLSSSLLSQSLDLEKADEEIASARAQARFAIDEKERELKEAHEMFNRQIAELHEKLKDSESNLSHGELSLGTMTAEKMDTLAELCEAKVSLFPTVPSTEIFGIQ